MSKFFTQLAYTDDSMTPVIRLSSGESLSLIGKTISLRFDTSERFCIGWHDISTGKSHPCPDSTKTDKKYDTCVACQRRTGFNPAFYHTNKISPQQEARNAEPHILYLAYMGNDYVKAGISWGKRGTRRLLDQGARAGLILETFPTALIARQYEAKLVGLNNVHETTPTRTKLSLMSLPFDEESATKALLNTKQQAEEVLNVKLSGSEVLLFDKSYTDSQVPSGKITTQTDPVISGKVMALVGDILLTNYNDRTLAMPLKRYLGYPLEISYDITTIELEPEQMQLF